MTDGFIASESGSIKISEEVITRISSIAAREVEGVVALGNQGGSLSEFLGKKSQAKGVKVEMGENSAEIDIHISVKFGVKICEVARKVQESVKFALESYVGMESILINVFVDAIDLEKAASVPAQESAEALTGQAEENSEEE